MADQGKPAPMKVGANTMSFMWKTSAREALETLAKEGYRCFEVMAQRPHFDPFMERAEALAFARFLREAGLTVETVNLPSLDQNLASAAPEMREYSVRLFERLVAIAETIGAAAVVVVTGRVNPLIAPARATVAPPIDTDFAKAYPDKGSGGPPLIPAGNAVGQPALSVPSGFGLHGLPTGIQFTGRIWSEDRLVALAHLYQRETDWHRKLPQI